MTDTFFVSANFKYYLYSLNKRQSIVCSLLFKSIFTSLKKNGIKYHKKLLKHLIEEKQYFVNDIEYEFNKFFLLLRNGFFLELEAFDIPNKRLSKSDIEYSLSNITHIMIEVTDNCNLNCTYCAYGEYYRDYDERTGIKMKASVAISSIKHILNFIRSGKNSSSEETPIIISFYGGEPTLNMPLIKEVIKFLENSKVSTSYSMTTNAQLLTKHIDYFVRKNFKILISLDGEEKNNIYRNTWDGKNSFKKTYQNLQLIYCNYPDFFQNNISFNSVQNNTSDITEINNFFKKEYNKIPTFSEISLVGINEKKKNEFKIMFKAQMECFDSLTWQQTKEVTDHPAHLRTSKFLFNFTNNFYDDFIQVDNNLKKDRKLPSGTCIPFARKFYVSVNGKILPCQLINQKEYFGIVNESDVILDIENVTKKANDLYDAINKQCSKCYNILTCTSCIYLNIREKDGEKYCDRFMSKSNMLEFLKENFSFLENHPEEYDEIVNEGLVW